MGRKGAGQGGHGSVYMDLWRVAGGAAPGLQMAGPAQPTQLPCPHTHQTENAIIYCFPDDVHKTYP